MAESRVVRLVKQFSAGEAQATLALSHLNRTIAPEAPGKFLERGIKRCGLGVSGLEGTIDYSTIATLGGLLLQHGITWERVATEAEVTPRAAAQEQAFNDLASAAFREANAFMDAFEAARKASGRPRPSPNPFWGPKDFNCDPDGFSGFTTDDDGSVSPSATKAQKARYGRLTMPPALTGLVAISYEGKTRNNDKMIRFRVVSDEFILMTELVAFGTHAEIILAADAEGKEITVFITVPEDMGKLPTARVL